ncbi:MAG: LptA/OstA family protein [Candidatus Margulisiibacteriota bacterium]
MDLAKKLLYLLFFGGILFLFIWAVYVPKEDVSKRISSILEEQVERQDVYFEGVTLQEVYGGQKFWEIKARSSSINKDSNIATLEAATGTFFEKNKPVLNFIAPRALWNMDKKEIYLLNPIGYDVAMEKDIKNLLARQKEKHFLELPENYKGKGRGYFFRAKNLYWSLANKKIVCPDGIWLFKGNMIGYGRQFEADVTMEKVVLSGDPRITIIDTSLTTVEAQSFIADNPRNTIFATDGVVLISEGIRIYADNVVFDQKKKEINLSNNVEVTYLGIKATAKKASYDVAKARITLFDSALLERNNSALKGDKVIISVKEKEFKVSGKTSVTIPEKELEK